jgi:hypothetical protein
VVACGKQQNAASTPSQSTSPVLTSFGTSAAILRCGNTSWNACGSVCASSVPSYLLVLQACTCSYPVPHQSSSADGGGMHAHKSISAWHQAHLASLAFAGQDLHCKGGVERQQAHYLLARVAAGAQHRDASLC